MAITAAITSAVIGLGGSLYSADEQKKQQKENRKAQNLAEVEAKENEKLIRDESARQQGDLGASYNFGDGGEDEMGSYDDFLSPVSSSATANSGLSGGSVKNSGLGLT